MKLSWCALLRAAVRGAAAGKINEEQLVLRRKVEQARREWQDAQNYYEVAVDHDLIDYAIYHLKASEIKYMYLLKHAKKDEGSCLPLIYDL